MSTASEYRFSWWHVIGALFALGLVLRLAGFSGDEERQPAERLDADSSCEERYEAAANSPVAREFGTDGMLPRSEWIANCESGR